MVVVVAVVVVGGGGLAESKMEGSYPVNNTVISQKYITLLYNTIT